MDLSLSDDQRLLQDSADRLTRELYTWNMRAAIQASVDGFSRGMWRQFAELGWLALPIPEGYGGLGGNADDIYILMESLGKALVLEPYLSTALLCAGLISEAGSEEQCQYILPKVAAGDIFLSFAHAEKYTNIDPFAITTTATPAGEGWSLRGSKIMVLDGPSADMLLVSTRLADQPSTYNAMGVFLVSPNAPGLVSTPLTMIDGRRACNIALDGVYAGPGTLLGNGSDALPAIEAAMDRAIAAGGAFTCGAMQMVLDKTSDYLKTRIQFGRPLSHNQVLRHRIADMALQCEQARVIALRAALMMGRTVTERKRAASAAKVKIGRCARFVTEHAVQLHGGMGVTEELDIGAYLKWALSFQLLFGSEAITWVATRLLRPRFRLGSLRKSKFMDLSYTAEEEAFREEVRHFLDAHLSAELRRAFRLMPSVFTDPEILRVWQQKLHCKGWVAPYWPKEHGGPGWTVGQTHIFEEECAKAHAPTLAPMGLRMVGPVIMKFGNQAQKDFYLPRILSGEDYWCQGYSEPDAGSDLASLKTRAVADGDSYIINGTKIWTRMRIAPIACLPWCGQATPPRKQDGISFLLIDMKTPGITIRPIITIGGDHEVNQVFFDDVRVPRANLVGEEGAGWSYGKYLLEFERGGGSVGGRIRQSLEDTRALYERLTRQSAEPGRYDPFATRFSELEIDIDTFQMIELRMYSVVQSGDSPGLLASYIKIINSELKQAVARLGVDILAERGLAMETERPLYRLSHQPELEDDELAVMPYFLNGRATTIYGGERRNSAGDHR